MDVEKATTAVRDLLTAFGVDEADHTAETPDRVARAWATALAGYECQPARHLERTFTAPLNPGLVVLAGIQVRSTCAHHLLPITGWATVAYRPTRGARIVGLSKLARVLEEYAARLQVQERLGWQTAATVQKVLNPVGAACVITAAHGCISLRGVEQPHVTTTTIALTGEWEQQPDHPNVTTVLAEHRAARGGSRG